jgi:phthiodiolone/phenolphthiodiolone dimycocerosates ketoreductase
MRFAVILGDMYPADRAVKCGVLAERYGFHAVFVPDHLADIDGARIDCWTVLGAIASNTSRILLSPGVADIHHIIPAKMAQIVATLDELSAGRAVLAVGAGEAMNIVPFGLEFEKPKDRILRLREYIEVVKLLWRSSRDNLAYYKGKFYTLNEAFIDQKYVRHPHPLIYVGAIRSRSLMELIGEMADGWFSWIVLPETCRKNIEIIRESALKHGRNPDGIDAVVWIYTCLTEDPNVRRTAVNIGKAYLYVEKSILERHGYKLETPDYTYLLAHKPFKTGDELVKAASIVPEEIVEKAILIGDVNNCIERVDEYRKAGAKCVGFRIMTVKGGLSIEESMKLISEKVIPYFTEIYK